MKVIEIRQQITERLIKLMETSQDRPWRCPWSFGPNHGVPSSAATGKPYRGANALTLDLASMIEGYKSKHWNTFANWKREGVFPKSGTHGTWGIYYGGRSIDEEDESGEPSRRWQPIARAFAVFNAEQCHGPNLTKFLVPPVDQKSLAFAVNYESFDALIARLEIDVDHDGNLACFRPTTNIITMPARGRFANHQVYYSTLAHELTHWADSQLDGKSDQYPFNELVAEIGSAYLLRDLGLPATETDQTDHNAAIYLSGWIKSLKSDDRYIFRAASRASKLVDFMVGWRKQSPVNQEAAMV